MKTAFFADTLKDSTRVSPLQARAKVFSPLDMPVKWGKHITLVFVGDESYSFKEGYVKLIRLSLHFQRFLATAIARERFLFLCPVNGIRTG
jgi:hypothetical protein